MTGRVVAWMLAGAASGAPAQAIEMPGTVHATQQERRPFLGGYVTESRIVYPLEIGEWKALGEHRFEQAEMGVSVRYQHRRHADRRVDVYFYPAGVLEEGRLQREAEATLEGIEAHGGETPAGMIPLRSYTIGTGNGSMHTSLPAYSAVTTLGRDGQRFASAMVVLAKDLYFIKGRASVGVDATKPARLQSQLQSLMERLVRDTSLSSTGGCWSPPATDGAGAAAGEDAASASASASASVLVPAGCHPPDAMTPDVPATHREIRFEYRAPHEHTDGSAPRLRKPRRGIG